MTNTAPQAFPISVQLNENGEVEIRVFFQDFDLGDTHSLELHSEDMIGSGTVIDEETFRYDPGTAFDYLKPGEIATDTFNYTVTDASGATSTQTVTINITGQNDGPVAVSVAAETDENTSVAITPNFSDADVGDSHRFAVDTADTKGLVTLNEDGTFTYDPNGQFDDLKSGETATDTFSYTVTDKAGESSTETVTVTINGVATNTPPDTFPYEFTTDEDGKIVFRAIFHDPDVGDTHTYSLNTDGLKGTLTETGDGVFEYDPSIDFDYLAAGETATTTFTYTVTDSFGASDTDTITITVTGRNDAPVAAAMNVSTTESSALVIVPDFVDPDASDTHTFTVDSSSTTGTVTINDDGTFTYNPNGQFDDLDQGERGTDSFTYTVTDASGASSTETVTVTVNGESDFIASSEKILASDGAAGDNFGREVDINDHGIIVIGSPVDDDNGDKSGSAYVYTPATDGGYTETKLVSSDNTRNDWFGINVAINNSGAIVVASYADDDNGFLSGSVYLFTPTEGGGYSETKLSISNGERDALGVHGLSINDDGVIAVSAYGGATDKIFILTPDENGGYQESILLSPTYNGFGGSLSLGENGVVCASSRFASVLEGVGFARIYSPDGEGGYTEMQLIAPDENRYFGRFGKVRKDGSIIIGSLTAVYDYQPDGNGGYTVSKFGSGNYDVATNEQGVIVLSSSDVAYVYVPDDKGGYKEITLTAYDGGAGDLFDAFGSSVSINEDGVITVGARLDDDKGQDSGSVYVFVPDEDGNYIGPDGTVYEPSDTPLVIETFDSTPLTINGSENAEMLKGSLDADTISGNGGDDVIDGGAGDDTLSGGEGNDTFVFAAGETGHDTIQDFAGGEGASDVIEFEASVFADFDAVLAAAAQDGTDTVISIDEDTSITLEGVILSDLHHDDFSFV